MSTKCKRIRDTAQTDVALRRGDVSKRRYVECAVTLKEALKLEAEIYANLTARIEANRKREAAYWDSFFESDEPIPCLTDEDLAELRCGWQSQYAAWGYEPTPPEIVYSDNIKPKPETSHGPL